MMKKKSAWVVTWESLSQDCPDLPERIISIRDGRTSPERIREFIEQHYMATQYSLREKILFQAIQRTTLIQRNMTKAYQA